MMEFPFHQDLRFDGQNITLHSLHRTDAISFFRLVQANHHDLLHSFPIMCGEVSSVFRTRSWLSERRRRQARGHSLVLGIRRKEDGALIGYLAAMHMDHRVPKCELAYFMDAASRGKGYMLEALQLLLDYLFYSLGFNKVLCRVATENNASLRLLEALGFVREGLIRNDFRSGQGVLGDCVYMGRIHPRTVNKENVSG
jgi:ribosomal-protein-serine acetyltransferase